MTAGAESDFGPSATEAEVGVLDRVTPFDASASDEAGPEHAPGVGDMSGAAQAACAALGAVLIGAWARRRTRA